MKSNVTGKKKATSKARYATPGLKAYGRLGKITRGSNASSIPDGSQLPHNNVKPNNQDPS